MTAWTALSQPGSSVSRRACTVWLLIAALSLPAVTVRIYASDEIEYFAFLRSLWFDRDLSFENEYQHFYDAGIAATTDFHETFLERRTETGLRLNFATIGCALLWSPFYAIADAGTRAARLLGSSTPADGYAYPYLAAVCYGSALYGLGAVLLSWIGARRMGLHGTAAAAALAVWIGTPLLFYTHVAPPMSHACSAFMVALFVLTWLRVRTRWSWHGCAWLGGIAAVMTMVREQDAFFVCGPALDFLAFAVGRIRARSAARPAEIGRLAAMATAGIATGVLVFTPQALAYLALNGRLGPSGIVERKMTWSAPHALQVLLSPEHGLLVWTPLVALGLLGLCLLSRVTASADATSGSGWLSGCFVLMVAAQVYVAGSVESWTVAGAFGQRRFVALTMLVTIGLAALLQLATTRRARLAASALVGLCVWWNLGLMAQFGAGLMDRQRLELGRNAYTTFVILPGRAPAIVHRYLFDRASYYRPAR